MDQVTTYKKIVRELVEYVYSLCPHSDEVEVQKITDDANGHYLLYSVGWQGMDWVYGSFVHLDVRENGRVWLQHDGTDLNIADELARRGIPKNNIVVGFQPPHLRPLMEDFAVA
ncbi:MAG: XisI protein [Bacteroidia bacterium]|nr:XisI protein [Bacteroidia bacterium]